MPREARPHDFSGCSLTAGLNPFLVACRRRRPILPFSAPEPGAERGSQIRESHLDGLGRVLGNRVRIVEKGKDDERKSIPRCGLTDEIAANSPAFGSGLFIRWMGRMKSCVQKMPTSRPIHDNRRYVKSRSIGRDSQRPRPRSHPPARADERPRRRGNHLRGRTA